MTLAPRLIHGTTRVAAVLGWPVEHSRSPAMLNAAFEAAGLDSVMIPIGVPPESLAAAVHGLRAMRALGASVTVPHKLAALALCDEVAPDAATIGAVNCLQLVDGRLVGHNTDAGGFADGLAAAGFDVRGKRAVILGGGGAARAVAFGLRAARVVEVIARRPTEASWARAPVSWGGAGDFETHVWGWSEQQLRESFSRADLLVDCTPAGLDEGRDTIFTDALPVASLASGAFVATLVYHRRTDLLERTTARGHSTLDGKAMLVHQGARAFTLWTGLPAPVDVMARALDASLAR